MILWGVSSVNKIWEFLFYSHKTEYFLGRYHEFVCRLVCAYLAMYVHLHMRNANSISEDCKSQFHLQRPCLLLSEEDNIVLSFYK